MKPKSLIVVRRAFIADEANMLLVPEMFPIPAAGPTVIETAAEHLTTTSVMTAVFPTGIV